MIQPLNLVVKVHQIASFKVKKKQTPNVILRVSQYQEQHCIDSVH